MKTRQLFTLCLCSALLVLAFQAGASAEPEFGRTNRRDPFASLLAVPPPAGEPLPSEDRETVLQQYKLEQFRVLGIVLGELGRYAVVLAPDGKRYMISQGASIGMYDGAVSNIGPNSIQVREIHRSERNGEISVKEVESTLFLDPLKSSRAPESRFVVVRK